MEKFFDKDEEKGELLSSKLKLDCDKHKGMIAREIEREGGYLFKMKVSELHEKPKKWWDTFFVSVLGVLQIVAGIGLMAMPGTGVFLTTFAGSLLAGGIKDLAQSVFAVFKDIPLNFSDYISSKGISLAIAACMSAGMFLIQKISEFYNLEALNLGNKIAEMKKAAETNPFGVVTEGFINAGKNMIVTIVADKIFAPIGYRNLINKEEIQAQAQKEIGKVVDNNNVLLRRLVVTDEYCRDNTRSYCGGYKTGILDSLYNEIEKIFANYQWSLSDGATIALDSTTGIVDSYFPGMGTVVNSLSRVTSNTMESAKVIDKVSGLLNNAIVSRESQALSSGQLFGVVLEDYFQWDGIKLANELHVEGLNINEDYDCSQLSSVKFADEKLSTKFANREGIVGLCNKVKKALKDDKGLSALKETCVDALTKLKETIQKGSVDIFAEFVAQEFVAPVVDLAVDKIGEGINKLINKAKENPNAIGQEPDQEEPIDSKSFLEEKSDNKKDGGKKLNNNKDSSYLDKLWEENLDKYRKVNGLDGSVADRFEGLFNEPVIDGSIANVFGDSSIDFNDNQIGLQRKPTIELVVREVALGMMHGFTIFTDSEGQKTIIVGYPEEHNPLLNLQVVDVPYIKANEKLLGDDWATTTDSYKNNDKYKIIMTKTLDNDQELNGYLSKAREAVKFMETGNKGERFDYDVCFTAKCWGENSNTVQRKIYDTMGIEIKPDNNKPMPNMPGIEGKFYNGPMDEALLRTAEAA